MHPLLNTVRQTTDWMIPLLAQTILQASATLGFPHIYRSTLTYSLEVVSVRVQYINFIFLEQKPAHF